MQPLVFGLGPQELLLILLILVVLFGARKIPEIARGLGEGIRGFRSSLKGGDSQAENTEENDGPPKSPGQS